MSDLHQAFKIGIQHRIFNNEVRKRRLVMGLTQQQLAQTCELGKATISRIETFRLFPSEAQGIRIGEVLNEKPEVLFPQWLEYFKPKRTSVTTEHEITPQMLTNGLSQFMLESGDNVENVMDDIDREFLANDVEKAMATLTPREAKVVRMSFGLGDRSPRTHQQIGQEFRVTGKRIGQIQAKAMRKLKHPSRTKHLKAFLCE